MSREFRAGKLAVVGLGLMGGSLAMALRPHAKHITGVDTCAHTRDYAMRHGVVDCATADLYEGVRDADVVLLALPVKAIIDTLRLQIGTILRSNTLLLDIGSTKQDIVDAMSTLPIGVKAMGGHPMTGKEQSGIEESDAALFRNRPFVLCPFRRTTPAAREGAVALVDSLGAIPIIMEAERHDQIVAGISHLPYLLSATLVATIKTQAEHDDAYWELAAGGFRDTSRLAASDVTMMGDILGTNTKAVATLLAEFRMQLAKLETMLHAGADADLSQSLQQFRHARREWAETYDNHGQK